MLVWSPSRVKRLNTELFFQKQAFGEQTSHDNILLRDIRLFMIWGLLPVLLPKGDHKKKLRSSAHNVRRRICGTEYNTLIILIHIENSWQQEIKQSSLDRSGFLAFTLLKASNKRGQNKRLWGPLLIVQKCVIKLSDCTRWSYQKLEIIKVNVLKSTLLKCLTCLFWRQV
jgi:hypothetical protein